MRSLRLLLLSCVLVPCSLAQPANVPTWLHGKEPVRKAGLHALGFNQEIVGLYGNEDSPKIQWLTLHGTRLGAIIFLPCGAMQGAYVGLLRRQNGQWSLAAQTAADCHHLGMTRQASVSVEVFPLLPKGPEILVLHNDSRGHGTGYSEQHMEIFEIGDGSLVKRFDTLEHLFSNSGATGFEEERQFLPHRDLHGPLSFQDTCVMTAITDDSSNAHKNTFRREIRWSAANQQFEATPFRPLGASRGSCESSESGTL